MQMNQSLNNSEITQLEEKSRNSLCLPPMVFRIRSLHSPPLRTENVREEYETFRKKGSEEKREFIEKAIESFENALKNVNPFAQLFL